MDEDKLTVNVEKERSYWWLRDITAEDVKELGMTNVLDKISDVLSLLQQVDNIAMDIFVIIKKNNSHEQSNFL